MSTNMPGFSVIFQLFLHHFALEKLATIITRVKVLPCMITEWLNHKPGLYQALILSNTTIVRTSCVMMNGLLFE